MGTYNCGFSAFLLTTLRIIPVYTFIAFVAFLAIAVIGDTVLFVNIMKFNQIKKD